MLELGICHSFFQNKKEKKNWESWRKKNLDFFFLELSENQGYMNEKNYSYELLTYNREASGAINC